MALFPLSTLLTCITHFILLTNSLASSIHNYLEKNEYSFYEGKEITLSKPLQFGKLINTKGNGEGAGQLRYVRRKFEDEENNNESTDLNEINESSLYLQYYQPALTKIEKTIRQPYSNKQISSQTIKKTEESNQSGESVSSTTIQNPPQEPEAIPLRKIQRNRKFRKSSHSSHSSHSSQSEATENPNFSIALSRRRNYTETAPFWTAPFKKQAIMRLDHSNYGRCEEGYCLKFVSNKEVPYDYSDECSF